MFAVQSRQDPSYHCSVHMGQKRKHHGKLILFKRSRVFALTSKKVYGPGPCSAGRSGSSQNAKLWDCVGFSRDLVPNDHTPVLYRGRRLLQSYINRFLKVLERSFKSIFWLILREVTYWNHLKLVCIFLLFTLLIISKLWTHTLLFNGPKSVVALVSTRSFISSSLADAVRPNAQL